MNRPDLQRRRSENRARMRRRRMVGVVVVAAVGALAVAGVIMVNPGAQGDAPVVTSSSTAGDLATVTQASAPVQPARPQPSPQQIQPAVPGPGTVISEGPSNGRREVALTIDDGTCAACVDRILDALEATGGKVTLFPNGVYASSWEPQATRIRALVANGQVTLANHTYSHGVSTQIGAAAFGADLQRNEDWIQKTFRLTGRPWFRPPYGDHNASIDAEAGKRGYRKVMMWSGTVADSQPRSEGYLLDAIDYWARPGAIILMHANYPATAKALPKIFRMLQKRRLTPVTLARMLGGPARASTG